MAKLTDKQQLFVDHYCTCWNATEAARQAGYAGDYRTLRNVGSVNLTKTNIRQAINKKMAVYAMDAEEALARLAEQARGIDSASLADVLGASSTAEALRIAQGLGMGHLIKRVKRTIRRDTKNKNIETEYFEIDLIDSQAALFKVLQYTQETKHRFIIETWEDKAIEMIKAGEVDYPSLAEALDDADLATQLFRTAGVSVETG